MRPRQAIPRLLSACTRFCRVGAALKARFVKDDSGVAPEVALAELKMGLEEGVLSLCQGGCSGSGAR